MGGPPLVPPHPPVGARPALPSYAAGYAAAYAPRARHALLVDRASTGRGPPRDATGHVAV